MGSQISVYELPSMGLLDKKSIKIDGVLDFEWCPDRELGVGGSGKENMFSYWTPASEDGNQPARVSLMAIPSRNVLRSKNLFNVTDVSRLRHLQRNHVRRVSFGQMLMSDWVAGGG